MDITLEPELEAALNLAALRRGVAPELLEPTAMTERNRSAMLLRMVPFVENNYNLVELGPRGTGKSHLYQQISPYAHLVPKQA